MKKIIMVSSLIFLSGLSHQAWAEKRGEDLSEEDIKKSVARILKAFNNQPIQPITEGKVKVGEISTEENEFYITYRPSLGMEVLACIDKSLYPFSKTNLKIEGHGHRGLTKLFSSGDIDTTIIAPFVNHMKTTQIPSEKMTIIIDGMSMGTHRAVEAAIYLKQHDDTKTYTPIVLRYGDSKTFDEIAVNSIYNFLPKENIISFHAEEDIITEFLDIKRGASLGTRIEFSAGDSLAYKDRVEQQAYTRMKPELKNIISWRRNPVTRTIANAALPLFGITPAVMNFLEPAIWERHQPLTYAECCPKAFKRFRGTEEKNQ